MHKFKEHSVCQKKEHKIYIVIQQSAEKWGQDAWMFRPSFLLLIENALDADQSVKIKDRKYIQP